MIAGGLFRLIIFLKVQKKLLKFQNTGSSSIITFTSFSENLTPNLEVEVTEIFSRHQQGDDNIHQPFTAKSKNPASLQISQSPIQDHLPSSGPVQRCTALVLV